MNIPVQRPCLGSEELNAVQDVFASRWLGMGATTQDFEQALQDFLGADHVIAVSSGTAALHLGLALLDLQPGDQVIVPSLTFVATPQAVAMAGAQPVFCDVDQETFNLDLDDVARRITPATRAIIPVHYGGTACDMEALMQLAQDHGLWVVEDAAHAFGSTFQGRKIGTWGHLTCFSFDPIKNITCGEGGAITTADADLAQRATRQRVLGIQTDTWARRQQARPWHYDVTEPGFRYHLSNMNAAIGLVQLQRFAQFEQRRQALAQRYDEALADLPGITLRKQHLERTCPFFYVIRVHHGRRDALMQALKDQGIGSGVHYIPNHLHQVYAERDTRLPVAERLYQEILTLPLYVEMTDAQLETVIAAVRGFFLTSIPLATLPAARSQTSQPSEVC